MKSENTLCDLMSELIRTSKTRARLAYLAIVFLAVTLGGTVSALNINLTYDPDGTFTAAGLSAQDIVDMKAANTYAALQLTSRYNDNINVNINVTAVAGTGTLGMSSYPINTVDDYATLRARLVADSVSADDATALGGGGSVPAADPIVPPHIYVTTRAQAKALGLIPDDMANDGTFTFGGGNMYTYDPNNRAVAGRFDFIGLVLHELTEVMGRVNQMGDAVGGMPSYMQMDLFHYTGAGVRGLNNGPDRFFSFDNGTSLLKAFNDGVAQPGSDPQDWASGTNDSFNAFSSDGVLNDLSPVDLQVMDVIGYNLGGAPATGMVANVATRLPVGVGDNVLIEGFIVEGAAGSTKRLIVRAIGPSLIPFGIPDALANPTLEIHDSTNATIATNDDWRTTQVGGIITGDQAAEIAASQLAPTDDLESAIIADLAPGAYSAIVRGAGTTTGTGVVDAFDLSAASSARLANIATRGLVQPGDQLMIAGFILRNAAVRMVIRGIGPSLAAFGVPNPLADTTLELRDNNGVVVLANDNWRDTQEAELMATGLQPTNDLEAAIVATLPPGAYSAQLRGKEMTGIGVAQVYFLQ